MCGYMKHRKALQHFGLETKGISRKTKAQREELYAMMIDDGYCWSVHHGQWLHLARLHGGIQDDLGNQALMEFRTLLIDSGVWSSHGARTNKINMPAKYGRRLDNLVAPLTNGH